LNIEPTRLGSPDQLASEIGSNSDKCLLEVVIYAYIELRKTSNIDKTWPEDRITRELCVQIQIYIEKNQIKAIPIHQYPIFLNKKRRGRPPTIDFVFRKGFEESHYFGFECKLLDDNIPNSVQEYVDEGVNRFLSGKYSHGQKAGGMVGYLIKCKRLKCVKAVDKQMKHITGSNHNLTKKALVKGFNGLYMSKHKQINLKIFELYHIFMNF